MAGATPASTISNSQPPQQKGETKMVKFLNKKSKLAQGFIASYERSNYKDLYDCYTSPSIHKLNAESWCRDKMFAECGKGFRILSYNTFMFTCGWCNPDGTFRVETPRYSYVII